jgi:aspartyl-tRNA(Asn)/glutamyl-tRNA(Gln) amidotransferase subunit A
VRHPAALCGVVGLKATYGRVSRFGGVLGTGGFSTDHFGPFARTVVDCAMILKSIAGNDPKDPLSSRERVPNYLNGIGKPLKGLRVGLVNGYFDEFMSAEVRRAFNAAVDHLKSLGMKVIKLEIPHTRLIAAVQLATSRVENVATAHEHLRRNPRDYSASLLYRHVKALLIPADTYVTAQRVRRLICSAFEAAFDKVDVIVAPTVGTPAQTIAECNQGFAMVDGRSVPLQDERGTTGTLCTIPFNVTGLPALSLCCGFSAENLPIGMQIVGAPFDEARIFQVGHAYEQSAGWYQRRPVLP